MSKKESSKNEIISWDSILDEKYGVWGTPLRTEFEMKSHIFIIGELLKEEKPVNLSMGKSVV